MDIIQKTDIMQPLPDEIHVPVKVHFGRLAAFISMYHLYNNLIEKNVPSSVIYPDVTV